jgi:hypothetical protein
MVTPGPTFSGLKPGLQPGEGHGRFRLEFMGKPTLETRIILVAVTVTRTHSAESESLASCTGCGQNAMIRRGHPSSIPGSRIRAAARRPGPPGRDCGAVTVTVTVTQ